MGIVVIKNFQQQGPQYFCVCTLRIQISMNNFGNSNQRFVLLSYFKSLIITLYIVLWQNGQTALHVAAYFGHVNIVLLLLQAGASPEELTTVSWWLVNVERRFWVVILSYKTPIRGFEVPCKVSVLWFLNSWTNQLDFSNFPRIPEIGRIN